MPTIAELVSRYQNFTDKELLEVKSKIDEYSDEAKEALKIVLSKRGGIENINDRLEKEWKITHETTITKTEIISLIQQGYNKDKIKLKLIVEYLSPEQLDSIIEETHLEYDRENEDKKIKIRTFFGSILGAFIGGTIGAVAWGLSMLYTGRMYYMLALGLGAFNYIIIRIFTNQSKKNLMVFVFTMISLVYVLLLGQFIFELADYWGYKKPR